MSRIDRLGEIHMTKEGYNVKIVRSNGIYDCDVQFGGGLIIKNKQYGDIKKGLVANPLHPTVHGVGYFGIGSHVGTVDKKMTKSYQIWYAMLKRCYDTTWQESQPTYIGCTVIEEWHNFQNFATWVEANYVEGFELDKDILVRGNKIYGPSTCVFIPKAINKLFSVTKITREGLSPGVGKYRNRFRSYISKNGVVHSLGCFDTVEEAFQTYKASRELYIKEVATLWKDRIKPEVYKMMYEYEVER